MARASPGLGEAPVHPSCPVLEDAQPGDLRRGRSPSSARSLAPMPTRTANPADGRDALVAHIDRPEITRA